MSTLKWKYETWRKLYAREQGTFSQLPLMARALGAWLLKLADDQGVIELGGKSPVEAVAFQGGATVSDRRLLRGHIPALIEDGYLVHDGDRLLIKNFVSAQAGHDRVVDKTRVECESATSDARVTHESALSQPPVSTESALSQPPVSTESALSQPPVSTESASSEGLSCGNNSGQAGPIPSFLTLPSLRSSPDDVGDARARVIPPAPKDRRDEIDRLWAVQESCRADIPGLEPLNSPPGYDTLVLGALNAGFSSDDIERALRVFAADATRDPSKRRYFDGTHNWRVDQIRRAMGRPVETVEPTKPRKGRGMTAEQMRDLSAELEARGR